MNQCGEAANTALEHQQAPTRELGARIFDNTNANVGAVFDLAKKLAGALGSRGDEHSDGLRTKPG